MKLIFHISEKWKEEGKSTFHSYESFLPGHYQNYWNLIVGHLHRNN